VSFRSATGRTILLLGVAALGITAVLAARRRPSTSSGPYTCFFRKGLTYLWPPLANVSASLLVDSATLGFAISAATQESTAAEDFL